MESKDMLSSCSSMREKIVEPQKTLEKRTKENSDLLMKINNLEYAFAFELKRATTERMISFEEEKHVFMSHITHLEKIIAQLTKDFENAKIESIKKTKFDSFPSLIVDSKISKLENESREKQNLFESEKCVLQTKLVELENTLTQQTKDFDDVKLELSNRTAKFEAYFEKLKNTKVVLERKLACKVDDSKAEKD
ncbi:hypothetical protein Tco_1279397 [Tanacetum coccineum]